MSFRLLLLLAAIVAPIRADEPMERTSVIVAVSAGGEEKYADTFAKWAGSWQKACDAAGAKRVTIGLDQAGDSDLARLKAAIDAESRESEQDLWIVLLGHGTADGRDAKFNLRGDDLAVSDLAGWLKPFKRTVIVICAFSSSGAWLKPLAGPSRVVVTATKSGAENNYARFGGHFAEAVADPAADRDRDGETSLLEAYLTASRKVADFYKEEGRIATEHSLFDDNGDGLGTPADWFQGVRAVKKSREGSLPDGLRARQIHLVRSADERALTPARRSERDALERDLAALRERKGAMKEEEYFRELEAILLKLARIYQGGS